MHNHDPTRALVRVIFFSDAMFDNSIGGAGTSNSMGDGGSKIISGSNNATVDPIAC